MLNEEQVQTVWTMLVYISWKYKLNQPLQAAPSKEPGQIRVQHEAVLEAACQENRSPPGSH